MKTSRKYLSVFLVSVFLLSGCAGTVKSPLNPKDPVTINMWHNFGGDMQTTMDALIDEFNSTVGKEEGIIINVTAITSSSELQKNLNMIAAGDPGAPAMPDITTAYPKTAILFEQKDMLADLNTYFTKEELSGYVPSFMEEGIINDGLYVFPISKSTEILYVNQTLFDRFAAENDVTMDCFSTFEGLADAAQKYYEWTDSQTPDILNDGKAFYAADSWLNLAQAGMMQQGVSLFENNALHLDNEAYRYIWNTICPPSISGGFAIYDGYSSDLSKTGDLVCSTGSSAGILFYGDTITYSNGEVEQVEYSILPFPVFEGGEKIAIQRGSGMMVKKSDEAHEYASAVFLKWFTAPEQNMRFISSTGYLPVTKEAFENRMDTEIEQVSDSRIKKMLLAVTEMYGNYDFFVAPVFEEFDSISKTYEQDYKLFLTEENEAWKASDGSLSLEEQTNDALRKWLLAR